MSVEEELKFQVPTSAPPFKNFWPRFQPSKIAWAPARAPQPWKIVSIAANHISCAAEEAEVCRESFMFWQNLVLQIFLLRVALLWVLTFHLNLESKCAAVKFRMY